MADQVAAWAESRALIDGVFEEILSNDGPENVGGLKLACWTLFEANLEKGRSLFAAALIKAVDSAASDVAKLNALAAVFGVVNSQVPETGRAVVGEILRVFKARIALSDPSAGALALFMAGLANEKIVNLLVVLEMAVLLKYLELDFSLQPLTKFRNEPAVKYLYEGPCDPSGLVLVPAERNVEHSFSLDTDFKELGGYEWDEDWGKTQADWASIQSVIWGPSPGASSQPQPAEPEPESGTGADKEDKALSAPAGIVDMTNSASVNLKKQIYLTVMSALTSAEAVHKLMRLDAGETDIVNVLIECCAQEKTSNKLYADIGFRLARSKGNWRMFLEQAFTTYYFDSHQHTTGELRNVGRLFGYLFAVDALDWTAFACVRLSPADSTPSNRIFLQAVLQEMRDELGVTLLKKRMAEPYLKESLEGIFPSEVESLRFAINYFTAIGLGPLTDEMRVQLESI